MHSNRCFQVDVQCVHWSPSRKITYCIYNFNEKIDSMANIQYIYIIWMEKIKKFVPTGVSESEIIGLVRFQVIGLFGKLHLLPIAFLPLPMLLLQASQNWFYEHKGCTTGDRDSQGIYALRLQK